MSQIKILSINFIKSYYWRRESEYTARTIFMKKIYFLLGLCMVATMAHSTEPARKNYMFADANIGTLLRSEIEFGCGCSVNYPPSENQTLESIILQWSLGSLARMFVNGELRTLKVHGSALPHASKVGHLEKLTFTSPTLNAEVSLKATWVCPVESEDCEVTRYTGVLKLVSKSASVEIPVSASCGC